MRTGRLSALLLALLLAVAACGGDTATTTVAGTDDTQAPTDTGATDEITKVAFVYVAPIGDLGWTYSHEQGRLAVEALDGVETTFIENVEEGPDAERVIREFAQAGNDIIITTSFGYMDPTLAVAGEFPDVQFVHISGFKNAPNMSNVFGRMYQPRYLTGMIAGAQTESNIIGYVAAFPIPEVIRGINAFTLGVQAVNPDAEVRVVWTNTWFGPPEEKEAAEALLDAGADVIAQHQDTTEPQKAAADRGGYSVGYNTDSRSFVGDSLLSAPIWDWAAKYVPLVEEVRAGTYDGDESFWGGLETGLVDLASYGPSVTQETIDLVEAKKAEMIAGDFDPFCGPIVDQAGVEQVAEGTCMDDGAMLGMFFFVQGVVGEIPEG
ncbi:MAG: BMP family ABC transporter substrate-binding protein [Acidimicrobiia bacterium]|nr:BMP family ABC transporter substrate-binding protein [Acidimicrobiia bacterium]